jgi:hypothetical protein
MEDFPHPFSASHQEFGYFCNENDPKTYQTPTIKL